MTVFLVGAGPGDPGLITVRGLELIRDAEAIVYDVLASDELLEHAPEPCLLFSREGMGQHAINELLVSLGQSFERVVRLKGGDPLLFARGHEEAVALEQAGIDYSFVPGVSALTAVPAAAGIPLTRRGVSAQVTVISGHSAFGEELDYDALADAAGTLVVFMGLRGLGGLAERLIAAGKPGDTPVAVISGGTTAAQETVVAPLGEIAERAAQLVSPALVVIGAVASLSREPVAAACTGV
ncbi:MAG TPA: uroporphyrinogen-III C-methyltransferase [Gaiellaceae bacterium]